MYDSMTSFVKGSFSVLTFLATTIMMGLFNALVISVLWRWFVIPVFHLPIITLLQAWGLSIFLNFISFRTDPKTDDDSITSMMSGHFFKLLTTGLVCLGVGWLLLHFM